MARRRPRRGAAAAEAGAVMCRAGGQQLGKRPVGDGGGVSFAEQRELRSRARGRSFVAGSRGRAHGQSR
jgi:hypothetical protein